jgi:pimeloyl-ACP methyl ester carboxylesterase
MRSALERETRPFWYGRWDEGTQSHAADADTQMSLRANAGYPPAPDYDVAAARAALASITAQTLVVVGSRDALTGVDAGHRFVAELPKAELAVIEDAGHFPWVDEPDQFRAVVEQFLRGQSINDPSRSTASA